LPRLVQEWQKLVKYNFTLANGINKTNYKKTRCNCQKRDDEEEKNCHKRRTRIWDRNAKKCFYVDKTLKLKTVSPVFDIYLGCKDIWCNVEKMPTESDFSTLILSRISQQRKPNSKFGDTVFKFNFLICLHKNCFLSFDRTSFVCTS